GAHPGRRTHPLQPRARCPEGWRRSCSPRCPKDPSLNRPRSHSVRLGAAPRDYASEAVRTSLFTVRPTVKMGRPFRDSRLKPGVLTRSGVGPRCLTLGIVPPPESRHKRLILPGTVIWTLDDDSAPRFSAYRAAAKSV